MNSKVSGEAPMRLSELTRQINTVLTAAFQRARFWVIADITNHNFNVRKNYHHFELVEKASDSNDLIAKMTGKAWGNGASKIEYFEKLTGQRFANNIRVLVQVSIDFHPLYGLQANVTDIDSSFTLGVLEQQKQLTLEKLVAENAFIQKSGDAYITRNNQLKLPVIIQKIAVISSVNSAGAEDFRHTLTNNLHGYAFETDFYFTEVQGDVNAQSFLDKMVDVFNSGKGYDILVVTRGGGSQTDFLIFDNYHIGRALAKFPIPVITGIGHQRNETIADLMVHTRTKTPTKAAEFIIAHNRSMEEKINILQKEIIIRSQRLFSVHFQSLAVYSSVVVNHSRNLMVRHHDLLARIHQISIRASRAVLYGHQTSLRNISSAFISGPKILLNNLQNEMRNRQHELIVNTERLMNGKAGEIQHHVSLFRMMSPENILKKGFAMIKVNNRITSRSSDLKVGEDIDIIMAETRIGATVRNKTKYNGTDFNL